MIESSDSLETGRKVAGIMKCDFGNLYAAMQFATIFGTTLAPVAVFGELPLR